MTGGEAIGALADIERLETGVPGLDPLLAGGLPRGRSTVVAGTSGCGKTLLALHLACQVARAGARTLFLAIEERPSDLVQTASLMGLGASELMADGRLAIVDVRPPIRGAVLEGGPFEVDGLLTRIRSLSGQDDRKVVVVDSVSALLAPFRGGPKYRPSFSSLVRSLEEDGLTVVMTAESEPGDLVRTGTGVEEFLSDVVLHLRHAPDGKRRRRSIEVHKYRRSRHLKGEFPLAITDRGVAVYPLDMTGSEPADPAVRRYPSGLDGLDRMTSGGWLRDSIVLVRGPTGSGKTLLAGMYAVAGAARGERVFYFGFEETREILLRNFEAIGIPIREQVDAGRLKVVARFPESTSPEDMIIELRAVLDEHDPSLIVLDSISAIAHTTPTTSFRHFVVGVAAALRQHGRSALLTQAIGAEEIDRHEAPYLSTLADGIISVGYTLEENSIDRWMRVLKMRGSGHEGGRARLTIGHGGLTVEPSGE